MSSINEEIEEAWKGNCGAEWNAEDSARFTSEPHPSTKGDVEM